MNQPICLKSTFNYEIPYVLGAPYAALAIQESFERDPSRPETVMMTVSAREAERIMFHLNRKYDPATGNFVENTGEFDGSVRQANLPEHKHPVFADCDKILTVTKAKKSA